MIVIRFDRELLRHPRQIEPFIISQAKKTQLDSVNECVFRLSFKKKYIFVKGRTAVGALKTIFKAIGDYPGQKSKNLPEDNLNLHFIQYFWNETRGYTFRVKVILSSPNSTDLLKCEQTWLWKKKNDPNCLNNAIDAYIPLYNEETESYGWINKGNVLTFLRWKKNNSPLPTLPNCGFSIQTDTHAH